MSGLTSMMNIGKEMEKKLTSVGIEFSSLSEDKKKELKEFSDFLKK